MKNEANKELREPLDKIIRHLKCCVEYAEKEGENMDDVSWGMQEGVLISYKEAKLILSQLLSTPPTQQTDSSGTAEELANESQFEEWEKGIPEPIDKLLSDFAMDHTYPCRGIMRNLFKSAFINGYQHGHNAKGTGWISIDKFKKNHGWYWIRLQFDGDEFVAYYAPHKESFVDYDGQKFAIDSVTDFSPITLPPRVKNERTRNYHRTHWRVAK